jgi:decaprenyl-phosphate phosphoribosyltransferase
MVSRPSAPPDGDGRSMVGDETTDTAVRPEGRAHALLRGARPSQWPKNLLVFVAPAAAGVLHVPHQALVTCAAFAVFCIAASGTYLLNDCLDAASDRYHPVKRHRPVASGVLTVPTAATAGAALVAVALGSAWLAAGWPLTLVVGSYVLITVAYSLWLKRMPVIEMAVVAAGFVLRAVAGGVATHVPLSSWFLVVASFGALFVTAGKRLAEHLSLGDTRVAHRSVLKEYDTGYLRSTVTLTATVTVTAYCLWAFGRSNGLVLRAGSGATWIAITVAPVVVGMLVMLRLLFDGKGGAPEEIFLHNRVLQVLGVVWVALFAIGLYG